MNIHNQKSFSDLQLSGLTQWLCIVETRKLSGFSIFKEVNDWVGKKTIVFIRWDIMAAAGGNVDKAAEKRSMLAHADAGNPRNEAMETGPSGFGEKGTLNIKKGVFKRAWGAVSGKIGGLFTNRAVKNTGDVGPPLAAGDKARDYFNELCKVLKVALVRSVRGEEIGNTERKLIDMIRSKPFLHMLETGGIEVTVHRKNIATGKTKQTKEILYSWTPGEKAYESFRTNEMANARKRLAAGLRGGIDDKDIDMQQLEIIYNALIGRLTDSYGRKYTVWHEGPFRQIDENSDECEVTLEFGSPEICAAQELFFEFLETQAQLLHGKEGKQAEFITGCMAMLHQDTIGKRGKVAIAERILDPEIMDGYIVDRIGRVIARIKNEFLDQVEDVLLTPVDEMSERAKVPGAADRYATPEQIEEQYERLDKAVRKELVLRADADEKQKKYRLANAKVAKKQAAVDNIQTELEEKQEEKTTAEARLVNTRTADYKGDDDAQKGAIDATEKEVNKIERAITKLERDLSSAETELEGAKNAAKTPEKEMEDAKSALESAKRATRNEEAMIAQVVGMPSIPVLNEQYLQLHNAVKEMKRAETERDRLQTKLETAKKNREDCENRKTGLERELGHAEDQIRENEDELQELGNRHASLKTQLDDAEEAVRNMPTDTQLQQAQDGVDKLSTAQQKITSGGEVKTKAGKAVTQDEIDAMVSEAGTKLGELVQKKEDGERAKSDVTELTREIDAIDRQIQGLEADKTTAEQDVTQLTSEIQTADRNIGTAVQAVADAEQELTNAQQALDEATVIAQIREHMVNKLFEARTRKEQELEDTLLRVYDAFSGPLLGDVAERIIDTGSEAGTQTKDPELGRVRKVILDAFAAENWGNDHILSVCNRLLKLKNERETLKLDSVSNAEFQQVIGEINDLLSERKRIGNISHNAKTPASKTKVDEQRQQFRTDVSELDQKIESLDISNETKTHLKQKVFGSLDTISEDENLGVPNAKTASVQDPVEIGLQQALKDAIAMEALAGYRTKVNAFENDLYLPEPAKERVRAISQRLKAGNGSTFDGATVNSEISALKEEMGMHMKKVAKNALAEMSSTKLGEIPDEEMLQVSRLWRKMLITPDIRDDEHRQGTGLLKGSSDKVAGFIFDPEGWRKLVNVPVAIFKWAIEPYRLRSWLETHEAIDHKKLRQEQAKHQQLFAILQRINGGETVQDDNGKIIKRRKIEKLLSKSIGKINALNRPTIRLRRPLKLRRKRVIKGKEERKLFMLDPIWRTLGYFLFTGVLFAGVGAIRGATTRGSTWDTNIFAYEWGSERRWYGNRLLHPNRAAFGEVARNTIPRLVVGLDNIHYTPQELDNMSATQIETVFHVSGKNGNEDRVAFLQSKEGRGTLEFLAAHANGLRIIKARALADDDTASRSNVGPDKRTVFSAGQLGTTEAVDAGRWNDCVRLAEQLPQWHEFDEVGRTEIGTGIEMPSGQMTTKLGKMMDQITKTVRSDQKVTRRIERMMDFFAQTEKVRTDDGEEDRYIYGNPEEGVDWERSKRTSWTRHISAKGRDGANIETDSAVYCLASLDETQGTNGLVLHPYGDGVNEIVDQAMGLAKRNEDGNIVRGPTYDDLASKTSEWRRRDDALGSVIVTREEKQVMDIHGIRQSKNARAVYINRDVMVPRDTKTGRTPLPAPVVEEPADGATKTIEEETGETQMPVPAVQEPVAPPIKTEDVRFADLLRVYFSRGDSKTYISPAPIKGSKLSADAQELFGVDENETVYPRDLLLERVVLHAETHATESKVRYDSSRNTAPGDILGMAFDEAVDEMLKQGIAEDTTGLYEHNQIKASLREAGAQLSDDSCVTLIAQPDIHELFIRIQSKTSTHELVPSEVNRFVSWLSENAAAHGEYTPEPTESTEPVGDGEAVEPIMIEPLDEGETTGPTMTDRTNFLLEFDSSTDPIGRSVQSAVLDGWMVEVRGRYGDAENAGEGAEGTVQPQKTAPIPTNLDSKATAFYKNSPIFNGMIDGAIDNALNEMKVASDRRPGLKIALAQRMFESITDSKRSKQRAAWNLTLHDRCPTKGSTGPCIEVGDLDKRTNARRNDEILTDLKGWIKGLVSNR